MYDSIEGKPARDYRYKGKSFKVVLMMDTLLKVIYDERAGFVGLNGDDSVQLQRYRTTTYKGNLTSDGRVRNATGHGKLKDALDHMCEELLNVSKVKGQVNSFMFNTNTGSWFSNRKRRDN